jgi:hypothetical protein
MKIFGTNRQCGDCQRGKHNGDNFHGVCDTA